MNPNWRMFPMVASLMLGTMAVGVSTTAPYPLLTLCVGLLCYAMAGYVAINWIQRVRYMRSKGWR